MALSVIQVRSKTLVFGTGPACLSFRCHKPHSKPKELLSGFGWPLFNHTQTVGGEDMTALIFAQSAESRFITRLTLQFTGMVFNGASQPLQ
jgi:hypothetical protein